MKKIICVLCAFVLVFPVLSCTSEKNVQNAIATTKEMINTSAIPTPSPTPTPEDNSPLGLSLRAFDDFVKNWWTGDFKNGHIIATENGIPRTDGGGQGFLWEVAMAVFALETLYDATGDTKYKDMIVAEWNYIRKCYKDYSIYVTAGENFNWAQDDSGWDAMLYMCAYRHTGDEIALKMAGELIKNSYEFWKDGDISNGLLYDHVPRDEINVHKSLHMINLMHAALDYLEYKEDEKLLSDTMKLYEWIEDNMLRDGEYDYILGETGERKYGYCDDMLYWANWNQDRKTAEVSRGPEFGVHPNMMEEGGYCAVLLDGIFAMGAFHSRLYKMTNNKKYLTRALETLRALNDNTQMIKNGVYRNLGDAWSAGAFMRTWINDLLTLPGVYASDFDILVSTAESIFKNARSEDGYYYATWSGPANDDNMWGDRGWTSETIMLNANNIHMIFAAALGESVRSKVSE